LIERLKTMKMLLELIPSTSKLITTEHFVGTNSENMNSRKLIIKALLTCNLKIFRRSII
jgi:hypothetical protein